MPSVDGDSEAVTMGNRTALVSAAESPDDSPVSPTWLFHSALMNFAQLSYFILNVCEYLRLLHRDFVKFTFNV